MVKAYLEDSSIAEDGVLTRFGGFLSKMGKGISSAALVASPLLVLAGIAFAIPLGGTALVAGGALGGAGLLGGGVLGSGLALTGAKVLTGLIAAGGVFKAADAIKNGQPRKAVKETLKGVAQGGAMLAAAAFLGPLSLLGVAALEVGSLVFTQKSLITHTGEVAGALLDSVVGNDKPKGYNIGAGQTRMAQMGGQSVQQQVSMTPQMQMGQLPAGAGMVSSSIPATVGYTSNMAQYEQPQSTQWRDQINAERGGQQQAPVRLSEAERASWGNRVELAHTAAHLLG